MRVEIRKFERQPAVVKAPHSKSAAHRMLICAGLASGVSTVRGVDISEDILATIDCLRALGAEVTVINAGGEETENITLAQDAVIRVRGTDPAFADSAVLRCRESGSTLRFMAPVAALSGREMVLTGSSKLMSRPLTVYDDLFREKGMTTERTGEAMSICGRLVPGTYTVPGNISSQFISGLLFALPLADGDSRIVIEGRAESRPYIDMTIETLRDFGVWTGWGQDGRVISIPGGQSYKAHDAEVEGDWSGAAFLIALGAEVTGLDAGSTQGDKICTEYFRKLDEGQAQLDITDCPDLGPVIAAYAACRNGCVMTGTKRLMYKESDRGNSIKAELAKFGVSVDVEEDSITVGCGAVTPAECLYGHNDHRIVMALSVICAHTGGVIEGAEAVNKSFPDFFERLTEMGVSVRNCSESIRG